MSRISFSIAAALLAASALAQEQGHNHPHDEAPALADAAPASGPVQLTAMMARNLDLQTAEVELRPIETTFPALGVVEPEPSKVNAVTSRIAGRITRLAVHDGQRVKAGDFLFEVESRVVADPPPRLTFTAPIDGVVLETHVIIGDAVEPDKTLVTLIDLTEVDVVARVFEGRIAAVHPGQTVRIRSVARPEQVVTGHVKTTAANVNVETATLRVFVHADNPDETLLPGMRARLAFVTGETDVAVVVPRAAVLGDAGDLFVFRVLDAAAHTYERTPVEVGLSDDRYIEIIDGVLPGDEVVVRGNYQLQYVGGGAATKIEDDHGHSHGSGGHQH